MLGGVLEKVQRGIVQHIGKDVAVVVLVSCISSCLSVLGERDEAGKVEVATDGGPTVGEWWDG